jgi:hypothetical protein
MARAKDVSVFDTTQTLIQWIQRALLPGIRCQGLKLTIHYVIPGFRMCGAVPQLCYNFS